MDVKEKRVNIIFIILTIIFASVAVYLFVMISKMLDVECVDVRAYNDKYIIEVINHRTTGEDNVGIRVIEQGFFNKKLAVSKTAIFGDTSHIDRQINVYWDRFSEAEIEIVNKETKEVLVRYTVEIDSNNVEIEMEKMEY